MPQITQITQTRSRAVPLLSRLALVAVLAAPVAAQDASRRLVAIGDIHGSIDGLTQILKVAGLTSDNGRWSGGRANLVQTGDYMDRGAGVRAVLDRLMSLESEAKAAGGQALVLLGNHEVMNLMGQTRDATQAIYATFADDKSEARREEEWEQYNKLAIAKRIKGEAVPAVYQQTREAWMAAHPPGYVEYRAALAPRGKYGAWLRGKPVVVNVGGTILMHAGIAPDRAPEKLDDLNDQVKSEIARLDKFAQRLIDKKVSLPSFTMHEMVQVTLAEIEAANLLIKASNAGGTPVDPSQVDIDFLREAVEILKVDEWTVQANEGPLWYRGYALLPDDDTGGLIAPLLARYSARRFVVGHTPQPPFRITVRFGGRVIVIDTGMLSSHYGGRASALEISGDRLTAIYDDGRVPLGGPVTGAPLASAWNQATVWRSPSSRLTLGR